MTLATLAPPAPVVAPRRDLHIDPDLRASGSPLAIAGEREQRRRQPNRRSAFSREQLETLWRMRHGDAMASDPTVQALIAAGQPPLAGGATGAGAMAFSHNLPPKGSYVMDSAVWGRETERNDVPQEVKAYPGLGGAPIQQRIPNNGILTGLRIQFVGSLVVAGAGTVTALYRWPWNIINRFTLNINGQTGLISCEGQDLRARRNRVFRNPRDQVSSAPATGTDLIVDPSPGVIANGTYPIVLEYEVPIVHNAYSLTGALFAQSDQTYLSWQATFAASAELFTLAGGSTATLTGNFYPQVTFYDIPIANTSEGQRVLIPDLQWLHGLLSVDQAYANTGDVAMPLIRTDGQLLAVHLQIDNGGAAVIQPSALNEIRMEYGGNRRSRVYNPPNHLLDENAQTYNGKIMPNAGIAVLDFEEANPARDLVYPKGVVELKTVAQIAAGTTINANAKVRQLLDTLYAGR